MRGDPTCDRRLDSGRREKESRAGGSGLIQAMHRHRNEREVEAHDRTALIAVGKNWRGKTTAGPRRQPGSCCGQTYDAAVTSERRVKAAAAKREPSVHSLARVEVALR